MPEEKKKESFTFSDKIKSTKASGANRSFANRFTSKIGSDGKPRQTLFERTKRDAPFFIAALVALLLLPFLYKYSGQVEEDTPMVSPGYEDAIVNPDRSGFDFSGDADGQISQLSGRDSMDLIVGWGKHRNEEEADTSLADFYRSGLDSSSTSDAASYKRSDMDEETNITNIYKRQRKQAPAQTRAAFRRAATKIGTLKGAGLTGRGGGRLGIGHFGGGLKAAAQKVRGPGQVNSTKPVSLQPLQAAGKPSRSYFGQGAAQEARRSKDAMSKGNAMQALMDAQMKPVEPGRIGGLASGDFGGPGGGPGGLQRNFNYNGKEPWWWDMMKQRAQMEWQLWFDLKKAWITNASDIAMKLFNCLLTGDDGGDVDKFLGTGGTGSGDGEETCCGYSPEKAGFTKKKAEEYGSFKAYCKDLHVKAFLTAQHGGSCPNGGYKKKGGSGGQRLNGWQTRWACMGGAISAYTSGQTELEEKSECKNMVNKFYQVTPSGEARKWNTYIYVVARNYLPETSKVLAKVVANGGGNVAHRYLCTDDSDSLQFGSKASAGVSATGTPQSFNDTDRTKDNDNKYGQKSSDHYRKNKERELLADMYNIDPEDPQHACVIYVQKGDTFNYRNFQTTMIERFEELLREQGAEESEGAEHYIYGFKEPKKVTSGGTIAAQARRAFEELDLMFIGSVSTKDTLSRRSWPVWLGGRSGHYVGLPMMYWRFYDAYVRHKGTKTAPEKDGGKDNVDNRDYRVEYVDYVEGKNCYFNDTVSISCENTGDTSAIPTATVTFKRGYKGQGVDKPSASTGDITVKARYTPLDGKTQGETQTFEKPVVLDNTVEFAFTNVLVRDSEGKIDSTKDLKGTVNWFLFRGKSPEPVDTANCDINIAGDGQSVTVEEKDCPKGAHTNAACCAKAGANDSVYDYKWAGDKCVITPKTSPNPDQDPNRDPNQDPNRDPNQDPNRDPNRNPSVEATAFAQSINWVPANPQDRKAVTAQNPLSASTFSGPLVNTYQKGADGGSCPRCKGRQFCDELVGYMMDSTKATEFVTKVRDAYNKKYQNNANVLPIRFGAKYPMDGEFIDALQIAAKENLPGLDKVSAAAVCELGRDFVRMSKDMHVGDRRTKEGQGSKGEEFIFHNELGAFLAYVHNDAILYPDAYVKVEGTRVCDWRFIPEGYRGGDDCSSAQGPKISPSFMYNNYNGTNAKLWDAFSGSLTPAMKQQPLAQLVRGHTSLVGSNPATVCNDKAVGCKSKKVGGKDIVKYYNSPSGFALMIRDDDSPEGMACEAFAGTAGTMSVADVLKYIQGVCSAGLDYKPHGVKDVNYRAGQHPTQSGGSPGSKEQVPFAK